ncbi:hypothetical protein [Macrococcus brunensis]|uniref:hypothetical protein n=1 Tax=Macrococcus brunensis TaxID=198483 RepID=UPI001EF00296|nr:hypothetical protein [Macrococcus brunensis]ULG72999.1 hypothetical protein MGG12_05640 [Macrococcus brunensis]
MFKIEKVKGERIAKCEVDYAGYQFEFSVVCDSWGYIVEGSNLPTYQKFQENIDCDDGIFSNLHDMMYQIARVYGN